MIYRTAFLTALLLCLTGTLMAQAQEKTPAFPGAEGFGRYTTGGRGGAVYHVTNLNDSGTGSLRWAVEQTGARTIVFDVSGTIHLESALPISSGSVTIAGQTAPGDGICVADYPMSINANNVIVRYMRFRLGNNNVTLDGADGWDGFGALDQKDLIIDHCSVSWSIDECLSVCGCINATVQWCISAQSLRESGHSKGAHGYGGNWGGSGVSFHHNLMAHHESRTPRLGPRYTTQTDERMDMRNNVIYNWSGNGCYGGEAMNVNIVGNYYKPGPATNSLSTAKQKRIASVGIRTNEYITNYPAYEPTLHQWGSYYVTGNANSKHSDVTNDNWTYGMYNQINSSDNDNLYTDEVKTQIRRSAPIDFITTTTHDAATAYERVLAYVGASLHRDSFDDQIISDTRNGVASYTGDGCSAGCVNSQDDNKPANAGSDWSAWPTLSSTTAPADTDGDGMPDTWETANGLNASDASDGATVCADGYTNLEHYLNSLVADITNSQNAGGTTEGSVINVGEDIQDDYTISPTTNLTGWEFEGGFVVSGSGTPATASNCGIYGIKYSRNQQYTITLPDGMEFAKFEVTGYCNKADQTAYLYELNNTTFGTSDYVFPSLSGGVAATHVVTFDEPVSNSLTFTVKGDNQVVLVITLYPVKAAEPVITTYTLSPDTHTDGWEFNDGFSITISGKDYTTGNVSGLDFKGVKYSKGSQYTINIPSGMQVVKFEATGYGNKDNETAYLAELNGTTFDATAYVYPSRTDKTTATHTVTLSTAAKNSLTFTPGGQQVVWNITLYTTEAEADEVLMGDVNRDGLIDINDVMALVSHICGLTPEVFDTTAADANEDGDIDINDVMRLVDIIVNN